MSNPTSLVQKLWNYPPLLAGYGVTGCNPAYAGRASWKANSVGL